MKPQTTMMSSKDSSWHEIVTLVLGPPRKLDFKEEAKQRARRKGIQSLKLVPSDNQCRFLWKFHASCDASNEAKVAATEKTDHQSDDITDIKSNLSSEKLNNEGITSLSPKRTQTRNDGSMKRKLASTKNINSIKSNRVSLSPSRKRPRLSPSSPGWITKSSFFSDKLKDQDFDFPDEVGIENNKSATVRGRTRNVDSLDLQRLQKCDCNAFDTKGPHQSPNGKRAVNRDDSSVDLDSPEEKQSAKRPKTKLFRPSVQRANNRFKQSSILHLFGKKA